MSKKKSPYMTVKEVADYLRVHEMSIYRMCKRGALPAYKVGNSWRFSKEKIDQWLYSQYDDKTNNNKE
ncbi:MAG: helix-turn-helix domain-containing protein [bacterium]|nr:helix-turn-helix domain-containing protein [bacterium]